MVNVENIQLLRSHNLLDIFWVTVEHEDQRLVVEIMDLIFKRCNIVDAITLWYGKSGNNWSSRLVVPERVLLSCERPGVVSINNTKNPDNSLSGGQIKS